MKLNNEIFPILFVGYNLKFSLFISLYIYLRCNTYIFLRNYSHLCSDLRIIIYSRKFIPSLIDLYISRSLKFIVGNNNNNNINDEHLYIYHFLQKNGAEREKKGQKADFRWINSKRESGSLYRRSQSEEKCDDT